MRTPAKRPAFDNASAAFDQIISFIVKVEMLDTGKLEELLDLIAWDIHNNESSEPCLPLLKEAYRYVEAELASKGGRS